MSEIEYENYPITRVNTLRFIILLYLAMTETVI